MEARYGKGEFWFSGTIISKHEDGTYDVLYDDGDMEMHVSPSLIRKGNSTKAMDEPSPESEVTPTAVIAGKESSNSQNIFTIGDSVRAMYKGSDFYFSGNISKVNNDGTYSVTYVDGEVEDQISAERIQLIDNNYDEDYEEEENNYEEEEEEEEKDHAATRVGRIQSQATEDSIPEEIGQ